MSEPSVSQSTLPITNFKIGFKAVWRTNFWSIVVLQVVLNLASVLAVFSIMRHLRLDESGKHITVVDKDGLVISAIIIVPILIVSSLIATLAQSRLILAGVRHKTESIGQVLGFAARRLWLLIKISMLFVGVFAAAGLVAGLLFAVFPPLVILSLIAMAVVMVLVAIRLAFITFVMVDDQKLSASDAIKRSINISRAYVGKIAAMGLIALVFLLALSFVVSLLFGYDAANSQIGANPKPFSDFISGLIMIPASIAAEAGFALLYSHAVSHHSS